MVEPLRSFQKRVHLVQLGEKGGIEDVVITNMGSSSFGLRHGDLLPQRGYTFGMIGQIE
jgi:hypothetical protein